MAIASAIEDRARAGIHIEACPVTVLRGTLPAEKTLEHGRRLIEFRTDVTVGVIKEAMTAARGNWLAVLGSV